MAKPNNISVRLSGSDQLDDWVRPKEDAIMRIEISEPLSIVILPGLKVETISSHTC
jgi:hypothetical protein